MSKPPKLCRPEQSFYGYDPVDVVRVGSEGKPGTKGVKGDRGEKGEKGDSGDGGDKHYRYVQSTASSVWNITHGLGKNPSVTVVDSGGAHVEGMIQQVSLNQVIITFSAAFAGEAFLN